MVVFNLDEYTKRFVRCDYKTHHLYDVRRFESYLNHKEC